MNRWRAAALAAVAVALGPGGAAAQLPPAQPTRYLLTTDVTDGRAVWINPAALARRLEASLGADLSLDRSGGATAVSQYGATLASRSLSLGWSHDRFRGLSANAYAIGLGMGSDAFSAGVTRRWYRGADPAAPALPGVAPSVQWAFWDLGIRSWANQWLQLSLVARNLDAASPSDSAATPLAVPAASARLLGGLVEAAAECDVITHGWHARAWRLGATVALSASLALAVRADLDRNMGATGFTVALQFEGPRARASGFTSLPRGAGELQAAGVAGALVSRQPGVR